VTFFLDCIPTTTTAQGKRQNHKTGVFFKDKKHESAMSVMVGLLAPYRPAKPFSGAVSMSVAFVYPHLKSGPKSSREGVQYRTTKPDLDNLVKGLIDVMASLCFFEDGDAQIADLRLSKMRGPTPGIAIRISEAQLPPYQFWQSEDFE
jgi:Holliday junction resolvase RusA-like endonuclease